MHARIAERIVSVARLPEHATVLEVGPGTGILTRALLAQGARVIAVEADQVLFEKLQSDFAREIAQGKLELTNADIRDYPQNKAVVQKWGYRAERREYHVVANIPYYLTGELFRMFLSAEHQPSSMTLLVQKEVAERIVSKKKKPLDSARGKESILSLSVKAYGTPKYEFTVPRGAFIPAPKVDSAVLTVRGISRRHFSSLGEERRFFALIHAGFAHKRKLLRKNLAAAGFSSQNIPERTRAEDLTPADWISLSKQTDRF